MDCAPSRYVFRSGAPEHPGDKFYNTTVEILPEDHVNKKGGVLDNKSHSHSYQMTDDKYLVIGGFIGTSGVAEGTIDKKIGPLSAIRLIIQTPSESWVILNEVSRRLLRLSNESLFPLTTSICDCYVINC